MMAASGRGPVAVQALIAPAQLWTDHWPVLDLVLFGSLTLCVITNLFSLLLHLILLVRGLLAATHRSPTALETPHRGSDSPAP